MLALVGTQLVVDARERSRLEALARDPRRRAAHGPGHRRDLAGRPRARHRDAGRHVGRRSAGRRQVVRRRRRRPGRAGRRHRRDPLDHARRAADGARHARGQPALVLGGLRPRPARRPRSSRAACPSSTATTSWVCPTPPRGSWTRPTARSCRTSWCREATASPSRTHALVVADRIAADGDAPAPDDATSVRWRVTATDLVSGATLWTYTTPVVDVLGPEDDRAAATATGAASAPGVRRPGWSLGVDTHAWILGDDGRLVRDVPLDPGTWIEGARSGVFIESNYTSADAYDGRLLLADGTIGPDRRVRGLALGRRRLGTRGRVHGRRRDPPARPGSADATRRTATVLWHRDDPVTAGLLLDGVLYIATDQAVEAIDATTGRTRWTTTSATSSLSSCPPTGGTCSCPGCGVSLRAYTLVRRTARVDQGPQERGGRRPRPRSTSRASSRCGTTPGSTSGWTTAPWPSWDDSGAMSDILRTGSHQRLLAFDEAEESTETPDVAAAPRAWMRRRAPWLIVVARPRRAGPGRRAGARSTSTTATGSPTWPRSRACCSPSRARPRPVALDAVDVRVARRGRHREPVGDRRAVPPGQRRAARHRPRHRRRPVDHPVPDRRRAAPEDRGGVPVRLGALRDGLRRASTRGPCAAPTSPGPARSSGSRSSSWTRRTAPSWRTRSSRPGRLWTVSAGHLVLARPVADDVSHTPLGRPRDRSEHGRPRLAPQTPAVALTGPRAGGRRHDRPGGDADQRRRTASCSPPVGTPGCGHPQGPAREDLSGPPGRRDAARARRHARVDPVPEPRRAGR